jgi:hypothetical protein
MSWTPHHYHLTRADLQTLHPPEALTTEQLTTPHTLKTRGRAEATGKRHFCLGTTAPKVCSCLPRVVDASQEGRGLGCGQVVQVRSCACEDAVSHGTRGKAHSPETKDSATGGGGPIPTHLGLRGCPVSQEPWILLRALRLSWGPWALLGVLRLTQGLLGSFGDPQTLSGTLRL